MDTITQAIPLAQSALAKLAPTVVPRLRQLYLAQELRLSYPPDEKNPDGRKVASFAMAPVIPGIRDTPELLAEELVRQVLSTLDQSAPDGVTVTLVGLPYEERVFDR